MANFIPRGADRMSDPDDQFRRDVARTRLYLMGDTGVGPEEDRVPLGLTRMSKIAMRRSAHLGEVQHEAAHASFSELRRTPDLAIEGLDGAVEQACERVMERAARIGREAGLDAYQEESYLDAARKGCSRLRIGAGGLGGGRGPGHPRPPRSHRHDCGRT